MSEPAAPTGTVERFGRPFRWFPVAVSAEAMALAWARQEAGPAGAAVVVGREIRPTGRRNRLWPVPSESTLTLAVILRPELPADEGDAIWLVASSVAAEAAEIVCGRPMGTWWPDAVVDRENDSPMAATKAEVQLGSGGVRSAVVTLRFDLGALGLGAEHRDDLTEAAFRALDRLDHGEADSVVPDYQRRCLLLGRRVRVLLYPKGETRGIARGVDQRGRLELASATGMVEHISVDALRELHTV
ncbi:MAG: hypothetical protein ACRD0U_12120 [Acidimicrobiales bacterium]